GRDGHPLNQEERMKIGVCIFATEYAIRIDELAREAEARNFEALWVPEHTHMPTSRRSPFAGGELPEQYKHTLDPFVALMAAAAATKKLRVGTGICLIIERDTITTAKSVASLDLLSDGRFELGIGGGWNAEEMEHHGTDFQTRFKRLEEQVKAMKAIWTKDVAESHGKFVDFELIWAWPKPTQKPHPPILLGGESSYTLQRVVDFCDGWYPRGRAPEKVVAGMKELKERAAKAGRDMKTISVSTFATPPDPTVLDQFASVGVVRGHVGDYVVAAGAARGGSAAARPVGEADPLTGRMNEPPPAWALAMLREARVGRLATADAAGRPLVVPVCFVFDGGSLYS